MRRSPFRISLTSASPLHRNGEPDGPVPGSAGWPGAGVGPSCPVKPHIRSDEMAIEMQPQALPDARGRFGDFGGRFVPESIMSALDELEAAYHEALNDPAFQRELAELN